MIEILGLNIRNNNLSNNFGLVSEYATLLNTLEILSTQFQYKL